MKKLVSLALAVLLVLASLSGLCFAADAEASWTDGATTFEGTFDEVMQRASENGGTVKLLKDIEMNDPKKGYAARSDSSLTFDLNGHTIYSETRVLQVTGKKNVGVTTITDSVGGGAMMSEKLNCNIEAGGIVLKDAIFWALTQQNVAYYDTTGDWNDVNLVENCTLGNSAWGAVAYNRTDGQSMEKASITYRNCALINAKMDGGPAVVVQSKALGAKAVFKEGVMLCSYTNNESKILSSALKYEGTLQRVTGKHTISLPHLDRSYPDLNIWATEGADPTAAAPGLPNDAKTEPPVQQEQPAEKPVEDKTPEEVIGGADGPTAITVAAPADSSLLIVIIVAAVVVIAAVVAVIVVAKKKK